MIKSKHWVYRTLILAFLDFVLIVISFAAALLIRFDFKFSQIEPQYVFQFVLVVPSSAFLIILLFLIFKMYSSIWRFASFSEFERIVKAWVCFTLIMLVIEVIDELITGFRRFPISVWVMAIIFGFVTTTTLRFGFRFISVIFFK